LVGYLLAASKVNCIISGMISFFDTFFFNAKRLVMPLKTFQI